MIWNKFCKKLLMRNLFVAVVAGCLMALSMPGNTAAQQNEYSLLKSVSMAFPEAESGDKDFYPFELQLGNSPVDGSKFSIYVPAGTSSVFLSLGASKQSTLRMISEIPEISSREISVGHGGSHKVRVINGVAINTTNWTSGKWVFFEYTNGAVPIYYYSRYRGVDTDHTYYSHAPSTHPTPPAYNAPPSGGGGGVGDGGSDYVPPSNPFDKIGERNPPFQGGGQAPPDRPVLDSVDGFENVMNNVQKIRAAGLSAGNYLKPIVNFNSDLLPSSIDGSISGHGYAMLEIDGIFFMVVQDSLGKLALMPVNEVGVRPFCTEQSADISEYVIWECEAFQIIQDFLSENGFNGVTALAELYNDGQNVVFYVGLAPEGVIDNFQGAAFQIVP